MHASHKKELLFAHWILRDNAGSDTEGSTEMISLLALLCAARLPSACRILSTYSSQHEGLQL
jgi:hypothetical protein